jgi:hypothetical protein
LKLSNIYFSRKRKENGILFAQCKKGNFSFPLRSKGYPLLFRKEKGIDDSKSEDLREKRYE